MIRKTTLVKGNYKTLQNILRFKNQKDYFQITNDDSIKHLIITSINLSEMNEGAYRYLYFAAKDYKNKQNEQGVQAQLFPKLDYIHIDNDMKDGYVEFYPLEIFKGVNITDISFDEKNLKYVTYETLKNTTRVQKKNKMNCSKYI